MGNKVTTFTEEQLEAYQDCTLFTRKEILRLFKRYRNLAPETVPLNMKNGTKKVKVPYSIIEKMVELKENPFCKNICEVFSEDGSGDMTFDDFLDMCSVFCEAAPRDIKAAYAFKIYDFDRDNYLSTSDLERTLTSLTGDGLTPDEINFVVSKVLEEADLDDDGMLSYIEFEHVISRSPDFIRKKCHPRMASDTHW